MPCHAICLESSMNYCNCWRQKWIAEFLQSSYTLSINNSLQPLRIGFSKQLRFSSKKSVHYKREHFLDPNTHFLSPYTSALQTPHHHSSLSTMPQKAFVDLTTAQRLEQVRAEYGAKSTARWEEQRRGDKRRAEQGVRAHEKYAHRGKGDNSSHGKGGRGSGDIVEVEEEDGYGNPRSKKVYEVQKPRRRADIVEVEEEDRNGNPRSRTVYRVPNAPNRR